MLLYGVEACPMLVRDKRSIIYRYSLTYEAVVSDWICNC